MIFGRARDARSAYRAARESFESVQNERLAASTDVYEAVLAHVLGDDEEAARLWMRFQGTISPTLEQDDSGGAWAIAATLFAVVEGVSHAWSLSRDQRAVATRSGFQRDVEDLLLGCAVVHAIAGDHERAAELLSCVRAKTLGSGRALPSGAHYLLYLDYRSILREALGAEQAHLARQRGEGLSLDEALDLAFA